MLREERMEFDKLDVKNILNRPILSTDERNVKFKAFCGKNNDSIYKRRRENQAHDKLILKLPFILFLLPVPTTVVFG